MPYLTLGQAANECGKQKSTLLNAISKGRLSASKDEKGQWQIDPAELFRVFPVQHQNEHQNERRETHIEHHETAQHLAELLERERKLLLEQIADLKAERDEWRRQATMLLTHQPETPRAEQPTRSRLYAKLFSKR
jgi:TATA-binding protein-associated factor Taf7